MILQIILGLVVLGEGYIIWNLTRKTERLETWIEDYAQRVIDTQETLNIIDDKGNFEADDEVGVVFDSIKETRRIKFNNRKGIIMPRKAKKGSPRYYFHQGTEDAIIRHNKETRPHMRERIYNEHIRVPFEKLAENIIHTFKFYYFDVQVQMLCTKL